MALELEGFNGPWPGEETPFPARECTAGLSYGRALHEPSFGVENDAEFHRAGTSTLVGAYQEGLVCLRKNLVARSESGLDFPRSQMQRLVVASAALGEESAVLDQHHRANLTLERCSADLGT